MARPAACSRSGLTGGIGEQSRTRRVLFRFRKPPASRANRQSGGRTGGRRSSAEAAPGMVTAGAQSLDIQSFHVAFGASHVESLAHRILVQAPSARPAGRGPRPGRSRSRFRRLAGHGRGRSARGGKSAPRPKRGGACNSRLTHQQIGSPNSLAVRTRRPASPRAARQPVDQPSRRFRFGSGT